MTRDKEITQDMKFRVSLEWDVGEPDLVDAHIYCMRCAEHISVLAIPRPYVKMWQQQHDRLCHRADFLLDTDHPVQLLMEADKTIAAVKDFDPIEQELLEDEETFLEMRAEVMKELKQTPKPEAKAVATAIAVKMSYEMLPEPLSVKDQVLGGKVWPDSVVELFLEHCAEAGWTEEGLKKFGNDDPVAFEGLFAKWVELASKQISELTKEKQVAAYGDLPVLPSEGIVTNKTPSLPYGFIEKEFAGHLNKIAGAKNSRFKEDEPEELKLSSKVKPVKPQKKRRVLG